MKKSAFVLSIVAISLSAIAFAFTMIELFYKKTSYIDSDKF